jgi:hypothetical protein
LIGRRRLWRGFGPEHLRRHFQAPRLHGADPLLELRELLKLLRGENCRSTNRALLQSSVSIIMSILPFTHQFVQHGKR